MTRSGQHVITVEGVGNASGLYHWCEANTESFGFDPSADPDGLYIPALVGYPRALEQSVDFVSQSVSSGSQSFTLATVSDVVREFYTVRDRHVAKLLLAITRTATTVRLSRTDLAQTVVHVGREAVLLGKHASGGIYTDCTRGYLDTLAQAHAVTDGSDTRVYLSPSARSLSGRVVRWYFVPFAADPFSGKQLQWSGVLHDLPSPRPGEITIQADDVIQRLRNTYLFRSPWQLTNDGTNQKTSRQPTAGYGTGSGRRFLVYVEDGGAYIAGWTSSGDSYDLASAGVPSRKPFAGQPVPEIGYPVTFREFVSTHADQPATSATPSTNTLPLSQEPAKLTLQLLSTTPSGGNFPPGGTDYDVSRRNLAGALRHDLIDYDGILAWGERHGVWMVDNLHIGIKGKENLFDLIQGYLRVYGASLAPTSAGLVTIVQLVDAPIYGNDSPRLTQEDVLPDSITTDRRLDQSLSRVLVRWGHVPGQDPFTEESSVYDADESNPLVPLGQDTEIEFDAPFSSRSAAQGAGASLLARFERAPTRINISCPRTVTASVGVVLRLDHTLVLGNGVKGVEDLVCLVVSRRERIEDTGHAVDLGLLYVGALYSNQGYWAPAATVVSWDAGARTLTVASNDYTSATAGPFATDAAAFKKGLAVKLQDKYFSDREDGLVVAAGGTSTTIVLEAAPSVTPVAGDILVLSAWTPSYDGGLDGDFAAIAGDDGELLGDPEAVFQWVLG